ncbi:hypothetical protein CCACVL1_22930 [Corchorus capsularis]|uniref:Reverse transcriptase n=1 Tax=Corchorus capsularis TaxID=210143 RepID=A0A1R3GVX9_COCAP|nr:hypothetical protein CCACVL1_22930 [Corchorus capsularis]
MKEIKEIAERGFGKKNEDTMYWRNFNPQAQKKLAELTGIDSATWGREITPISEGVRGVKAGLLMEWAEKHVNHEKGQRALALLIYGWVIFPRNQGFIDDVVVDLFYQMHKHQCNPVPAILAETLRSLNYCRRTGSGRFYGCAQLLCVWLKSHLRPLKGKFRMSCIPGGNPLRRFPNITWPGRNKQQWIEWFRNCDEKQVEWRVPCYKDWHRDRVKDLVLPPEKDPHYLVGPNSLDELTHLKYEVSRLREGVKLKEVEERHELEKTALNQEVDQYQLDEFLERLSDVKDKFLDLGRGINSLIDAWDKSEDSWKDALARMRKGVAVARELKKHVEKGQYSNPPQAADPTFAPRPPMDTSYLFKQGTSAARPINVPDTEDARKMVMEENQKLRSMMEERFKSIEGGKGYFGRMDMTKIALVSDLVIPPKFKVPEFEKFNGSKCPREHVTTYVGKMQPLTSDEKMFIHYFQDSLTGAASTWYNQLDGTRIHSWDDLANAFVAQYQYLSDLAPNRGTLKNIIRKPDNLPPAYYERLFPVAVESYARLIVVGELLEAGMKTGKIGNAEDTGAKRGQSSYAKKKDSEVLAVRYTNFRPRNQGQYQHSHSPQNYGYAHLYGYYPPPASPYYYPHVNAVGGNPFRPRPPSPHPIQPITHQGNQAIAPRASDPVKERVPIDPIPYTYTELLPQLLQQNLLERLPYSLPMPQDRRPRWYKENTHCDYHSGTEGHATEDCLRLKYAVQELVKAGKLSFPNAAPTNNKQNSLPGQGEARVSMIGGSELIKKKISEVTTPMSTVYRALIKGTVQRMMNDHVIEFYIESKEEEVNVTIKEEPQPFVPVLPTLKSVQPFIPMPPIKTLTQPFIPKPPIVMPSHMKGKSVASLVVTPPQPFSYKDGHQVPWKYECNYSVSSGEGSSANVTGVEPEQPSEPREEIATKKQVTENEACEFLKIIKQSEYSVIDQLNRLPAKISILSLLLNSEAHRSALLRVLSQSYVSQSITVNELDRVAGNISVAGFITFSDSDIPKGAQNDIKALHITVKCQNVSVAHVLIDNGSALNIMPLSLLKKLPVEENYIQTNNMIVRAFDGTKRGVIGEVEIPMEIGSVEFNLRFQVLDIEPSYSCLLGRPWIHMAGAVPSSLHQMVKFRTPDKLVVVQGEEDLIVAHTIGFSYVEPTSGSYDCSFRAFEVAEMISKTPTEHSVMCTQQQLKKQGSKEGQGLGKNLQGIKEIVTVRANDSTFGLGYEPTPEDWAEAAERKLQRRLARMGIGSSAEEIKMEFPPLHQTFRSAGWVNGAMPQEVQEVEDKLQDLGIHAVTEEMPEREECPWIRPMAPGATLTIGRNMSVQFFLVIWKYAHDEPEFNFERPVYADEPDDEDTEDQTPPSDLLRLVEQEEKQIFPHRESTELINLGTDENPKEVKIGTSLSEGERRELIDLLKEYVDVFAWSYQDMPGLNPEITVHNLPIRSDCKPVQQRLRRMKPEMLLKIKEEVEKQLKAGFLKEAKYPEWQANIVPVPKKDGKVRMCVDYRDLNRASPKDNFPFPHIDVLVDNTAGYSLFSFMDGFSGYNQIKMAPEDMEKTAFVTAWGVFCYKVMPFGLKNAEATYQRAMVALFHDMMHKEIEVNPGEWDEECQIAFDKIKEYLANPPVLVPPVKGKPLILYLTVFKKSMGCVLAQQDETGKKEHATYYLSKKFTDYEAKYSALEKMCCVLVWAAHRLRQYMLYHTTWLVAKLDPVKYVFEKLGLSGRIARWQVLLSEYDMVYVSQKAIKGSAIAEFLADRAGEDYESVKFEFPDEDLMAINQVEVNDEKDERKWRVYFDGASNLSGHGIGAVLISPDGDHLPATARLGFHATNNAAEYEACILGIQMALERKVDELEVYGDSALVIYQMKGEWQTRDSKMVRYRGRVLELIKPFEKIFFHYIPREENQLADALATLILMFKVGTYAEIQPIQIQVKDSPAHVMSVDEEVDKNPWYFDILQYIKYQNYPQHATENDRMSMGYLLNGDTLYKKSRDQTLLRCVNSAEAKRILEEVHEGSCGSHASGHKMPQMPDLLTLETDRSLRWMFSVKCSFLLNKLMVHASFASCLEDPL